MEKLMSERIHV